MNNPPQNSDSSTNEHLALQRWGLVSQVQDLLRQHWPLSAALEHIAASCPLQPQNSHPVSVAKRTLEDWYYAFQKGGFDALRPKARSDRGQPRRLSPAQQQWVLERVRAFPGLPVKVLYRQWKQTDPTLPALSAIYRWLQQNQLDAQGRRYLLRQSLSGPTKAFEAPAVNDLWMADFSPGPFLAARPKTQGTHLCVILDDHSRLVVYGAYGLAADTRAFLLCLQEAVRRRGLPRKLYTDNGGPFINDHLKVVCANLGIRLLHAKPFHAWSKGKCERIFRTIQSDFEATLRLPGQAAASLDELNARFSAWLQEIYHPRVHQGTGQTPQERFAQGTASLRTLDPQLDLARLFYTREERKVRKDGTIRIDNLLYEVDLALRGLKIELRFDPWRKDRLEVHYRGQEFGLARPLNKHLNSQIQGGLHYERA
jgi:putative transposase